MFTNLISRIHNCLNEAEILQAGVESVKQALRCDRVLVYSIQPQTFGKILAEVVAVGFPRTIDTNINDPCFKEQYVELYRQGKITTIENIYEAQISTCYVEMLERLAVKSNLVVPLRFPNGDLHSLLISHQCARAREWTKADITLAAQMAAQIGWALDNAITMSKHHQLQASIDRHHYYQELLTTIPRKIHTGTTRMEVLQIATAQVRAVLHCDRVVVLAPDTGNTGAVIAESRAPALAPTQGSTIELPYFDPRYVGEYQQGRVRAIDNIHQAVLSDSEIEALNKIAVKATVIVPITNNKNDLIGLLVAHQCFNERTWQESEVEWLKQIGIQTGLALAKAHLQEEVTAMKSSLKRASLVKESMADADTKIQQLKQSLADSMQTSGEVNHLTRLLNREVKSIATKLADEDINLVRIIAKKLQANAETATTVTANLQDKIDELSSAIDSGVRAYKPRKSLEKVTN